MNNNLSEYLKNFNFISFLDAIFSNDTNKKIISNLLEEKSILDNNFINNHLIPKSYYMQWSKLLNSGSSVEFYDFNVKPVSLDRFCQADYIFTPKFEKQLTHYTIPNTKITFSTEKIDFFRELQSFINKNYIENFTIYFDNNNVEKPNFILNKSDNIKLMDNINSKLLNIASLNYYQTHYFITLFKSRQNLYKIIKNKSNNSERIVNILQIVKENPNNFSSTIEIIILYLINFFSMIGFNSFGIPYNKDTVYSEFKNIYKPQLDYSKYLGLFEEIIFNTKINNSFIFAKIFENFILDLNNFYYVQNNTFFVFSTKSILPIREAPIVSLDLNPSILGQIFNLFYSKEEYFHKNEEILFLPLSPNIMLMQGPLWILKCHEFLLKHNELDIINLYNKSLNFDGFLNQLLTIKGFIKGK